MDQRVQIIIALMHHDLRKKLSLDELADSVNLSRSRFQHLFKSETGYSPAQYLKTLRLEHARGLLETSLLSVKQILVSVGIPDKSHFERSFKKTYGLTPTEYRAAHPLVEAGEFVRNRQVAKTAP